jgi:hypothetical protein
VRKVFSIWIAAVCASLFLLVVILVAFRVSERGAGSTESRSDIDKPEERPKAA